MTYEHHNYIAVETMRWPAPDTKDNVELGYSKSEHGVYFLE